MAGNFGLESAVSFTIRGIDHVVLRVVDVERALGFYREALGCPVEREVAELGLVQLRAGACLIDLVPVDSKLGKVGGGPPTRGENNLDHFCLQIRPMPQDEIVKQLKRHGIDAGEFSERYGAEGFGPSVYIKDPEGNVVELRCQLEKAAQ